MKKQLIGLTGRTGSNQIAGCGKDTVAEMVSRHLGLPIYGFADPLYDMVKAGFGIDGRDSYWSDREQKSAVIPMLSGNRPVSLRYLLETLGTEWGRNMVSNNLWTTIATLRYRDSKVGMVVKDVRFKNEQDWLDSMGGTLIHILRPRYFNSDATEGHPSNVPLEIRENDKVIVNDSSLDALRVSVLECLGCFS